LPLFTFDDVLELTNDEEEFFATFSFARDGEPMPEEVSPPLGEKLLGTENLAVGLLLFEDTDEVLTGVRLVARNGTGRDEDEEEEEEEDELR